MAVSNLKSDKQTQLHHLLSCFSENVFSIVVIHLNSKFNQQSVVNATHFE